MALDRFLKRSSKTLEDIQYQCTLKSIDSNFNDIQLNAETPLFIGRSPNIGITDTFCSRKQIELTADLKQAIISLEVCGANPSGLNGFMLQRGKKYEARHGDIIEVIYERHQYKVLFSPEPEYCKKENQSKKMKYDENESCEFKNEVKDEDTVNVWELVNNDDLVICTSGNVQSSEKIAAYDLDGTLIKTKSGNVHPKDISDWQIIYTEVIPKLKTLHKSGFKIVVFTNQAPIGYGRVTLEEFKMKIKNIFRRLNIPVQIFIATKSNLYRKPRIGMWKYLEENMNDGKIISKEQSFYVGDAAGRLAQSGSIKRKKDHSCADRLFALNIGLQFFTPEEHFLNQKALDYKIPSFNPKQEINLKPIDYRIKNNQTEMIIMVGLPGTGKSHFARHFLETVGYSVINRDTLGSIEKCVRLCEESLSKGKNCVIDNTNVDKESRKRFLNIAKKHSIPCRCFVMNVSLDQTKHNLTFRELTDDTHIKIKEPILFSLQKKYVEPNISEGFKEIVKVDLIPKFKDSINEKLYKMYLVEK